MPWSREPSLLRPLDRALTRTYKEGTAARPSRFTRERGRRGGVAAQSLFGDRRRGRIRAVLARWCTRERSVRLHGMREPGDRLPGTTALRGMRRATLGTGRLASLRGFDTASLSLSGAGGFSWRGPGKVDADTAREPENKQAPVGRRRSTRLR